jgi:hypothetical protein
MPVRPRSARKPPPSRSRPGGSCSRARSRTGPPASSAPLGQRRRSPGDRAVLKAEFAVAGGRFRGIRHGVSWDPNERHSRKTVAMMLCPPPISASSLAHAAADGQIGVSDDRLGDAARTIAARCAHRRDAIDESTSPTGAISAGLSLRYIARAADNARAAAYPKNDGGGR